MLPTHNRSYSGQQSGGQAYGAYQPSGLPQSALSPGAPVKQEYSSDGDVTMEDADPYNRTKYPTRPIHARGPSGHLSAEDSSAARRYSPMNALTPASPYTTSPSGNMPKYAAYSPSGSARQSPSRQNPYATPSQSYAAASRQHPLQQLSPMQISDSGQEYIPQSATRQFAGIWGNEVKSPRIDAKSGRGHIPRAAKIKSTAELNPRVHTQPAYRRANAEGGFISPVVALTSQLPSTYRICNPGFKYESSRNPRRVLTKPSKGTKNDGFDNEDSDYILYVNDILGNEDNGHKNRYLILDVLGQGTFGQVVKCQNLKTKEVVAVKVVKNRTAYFNQSMMEVSVLDLINGKLDKHDDHHLLRLKDTFIHKQHLCLVFELLSVNLYELIKQNQFRGLSTTLVRVFAQQLLNALSLLNKARLIHCDLKPENILLKNLESPIIKIIDFGSACDERQTVYTYIQSRFYRSPEVLLGLPYSSAIDMWSLGCIVVELFLGLPLFPGSSEYNQVSRIVEMLGMPPIWMLEVGKQSGEFFVRTQDEFGRKSYRLKTMEEYSRDHGSKEQPSKKYFQATNLRDIIQSYSMPRKNMKPQEVDREMQNRLAFIDFVQGLLTTNPLERWSPQQAKLHPFITQAKFTGPFVPPMNLKSSALAKSPAPGVQQQQQAEAASRQRQQQSQQAAQAHAQATQAAGQNVYANMQMNQNPHGYGQPAPAFNSNAMGGGFQAGQQAAQAQAALPPYPAQGSYGMHPPQLQTAYAGAPNSQNLYAQAATRAGRQRATTMDQHAQGGIPAAIQRVASHLDPNAPIRLQPSPAYYPPGSGDIPEGAQRRRGSRATGQQQRTRNFVQSLEDRTMEEGWAGNSQWH